VKNLRKIQQFGLALLILFALVGLIDSAAIHLKEIASLTDSTAFNSCKLNSTLDCSTVAKSEYSHIFGVPISLLGALFYDAIAVFGSTLVFGFKPQRWQFWTATAIILSSLLYSFWLLFISYFGIGALCPYCLVSDFSVAMVSIGWLLFAIPFLRSPKA